MSLAAVALFLIAALVLYLAVQGRLDGVWTALSGGNVK